VRRRVVSALAAVVALAAGGAGTAGPRVELPRDHYAHPPAGIEWWYVTGVVRGRDGRRYSVFFTLFRRGGLVLPVSQVIDLRSGVRVGHSERVGQAAATTNGLDLSAGGARLRYEPRDDRWTVSASAGQYRLQLVASPEKPYVLHGGGSGYIRQSVAGPSAYYSATRMSARGFVERGGTRVSFTGTAWFDHQWGSFDRDPRAFNWDWFSCRFDDRTELMLYRFRDRSGKPLDAYRDGTYVLRDGRSREVRRFDAAQEGRVLTASGRRWPLDWQVSVPAERLRLTLRSIVRDQLFHGVLVPTFWEGAATVSGSKRGLCFVEETYR
jgi:predicted secreted hydrolase